MKRLLYGGTFDPVHAGHIAIALAALRATGADRVCLVPASVSPHKQATVANADDRLAMCRLAAAGHAEIEALDLEVLRGGRSYTFDTVSELLAGPFRGDQVLLLLGQDALNDLPKWHRARELAALVSIAVAPRPGAAAPDWAVLTAALGADAVAGIRSRVLRLPTSPVSATEVRARRADGRSIRCWVPDAVADYIESKGLYTAPSR